MNSLELLKLYASSTEILNKEFVSNQDTAVVISEIKNIEANQDILFANARFSMNGNPVAGRIALLENSSTWNQSPLSFSHDIDLMVVLHNQGPCCRVHDDSIIETIEVEIETDSSARLQKLINGAGSFGCGEYIASLDDIQRVNMCTKLLIERVEMKSRMIGEIYDDADCDWNETFYIMLVKMMGKGAHGEHYMRVAKKVSYKMLCREKHSLAAVEAMLLGAAGFLENPIDKYEIALARESKHLQNKYNIRPMRKSDWVSKSKATTFPSANPVLRMAQIAALVCSRDFLFGSAMKCRTMKDLEDLLKVKASDYWNTHYTFGMASAERQKFISADTIDVIGINVVCMVMFCYGQHTFDDKLQEASFDLLEKIKTERNSLTYGWAQQGVKMENAYFSQAMLQLSKIYCASKQCSSCFVGKARLKSE